jgi:hypothetical protein
VPDCESQPPLWKWTADKWNLTPWGEEITQKLLAHKVSLAILDTQLAVTEGTNQLDNTQQYAFGVTLRAWAKLIGNPVVLTVSHTNQGSASLALSWRLHYLSRAGGNGLPGALRWAAGLSRLRPDDELVRQLGLEREASRRWLVALAVSKANEMPRAIWSTDSPAVLEIRENGSLGLIPCSVPRKPVATSKTKRQPAEDLTWLTPADDGCPLPPILERIPEATDEF